MTTSDLPLTVQRVRAYFAPVNRVTGQATMFDPAQEGSFALDSPPAPWLDLGWVEDFARKSHSIVAPIRAGSPASTHLQTRTEMDATLQLRFQQWGKLQLSLAAGTQQMNLLPVAAGAPASGSGGTASAAVPLGAGSTATVLQVSATTAAAFAAGMLVVVDNDYALGSTGYVGSGTSGAYVKAPLQDVDYVRRVSLNVARVAAVTGGTLSLAAALPAGTPMSTMKVSPVLGFCDREGSSFFQEWSALFVSEGQQGDRVIWHYPRLQTMAGISEAVKSSTGGFEEVRLSGSFRALPIRDVVDGEQVLCFRTYLPA